MAQFWESDEKFASELADFSAETGGDGTFVVKGKSDNFRWGFKLTSHAEVAALMNACRVHLATAIRLGPVDWQPHPEFAEMEIADVRGYRLVVGTNHYAIYQEEKIVVMGSASERPKQHALETLELRRPIASDAFRADGWEDITLARLSELPLEAAARWLARNPRHKLAPGLVRTLEKVKDRTTPAIAVEIVRALELRKSLVVTLAEDIPVAS